MQQTRDCPFCGEPQDAAERFCPKCGNQYPFDDDDTAAMADVVDGRPAPRAAVPWYRTMPFLAAVVLGVIVVGYALFRAAVAFLDNGRPEPSLPPAPVVTASPAPPLGSPQVIAPGSPSPSPAASRGRLKVTNTEGQGANLRQRPSTTAPVVGSVAEGTILDLVGTDQQAEGRTWSNVRQPGGPTGWIAAELLGPE
jgi:hypothetical protein